VTTAEIHYRAGAMVRGHFPGRHRSTQGDSGFEFRGHASLLDAPDARRLDLHASLRDPLQNWMVRVNSERKSIPVTMVADLSASMGFAGVHPKLQVMADFVDSLSWSAWRNADSFGFIGCDIQVCQPLLQPQTRVRGAGSTIAGALRALQPDGRSAQGLLAAHAYLSRQRSLVFLLSDFHLPLGFVAELLDSLAAHQVVPVLLWDAREFALSAQRGLAQVLDPETGQRRLVWWRPALRRKWLVLQQQRREALHQLFGTHRLRPLLLADGFDADAVTRYFHA
jgi:Mg-chelatase subunit ChlD